MNLRKGGSGGFYWVNSLPLNRKARGIAGWKIMREKVNTDPEVKERWFIANRESGKRNSLNPDFVKKSRNNCKKAQQIWTGSHHSTETVRLMSKNRLGSGNNQFGTVWITNGKENKKIKKDLLIPEGWCKGRNYSIKETYEERN
jgi:hypothetical protein